MRAPVRPEGSVVTRSAVCWLAVGVGWVVPTFSSPSLVLLFLGLIFLQRDKHTFFCFTLELVFEAEMRLLSLPRIPPGPPVTHSDRDRIPKGNVWNSTRCVVAGFAVPRHKATCSDRTSAVSLAVYRGGSLV